jgi:hypothetical protein
MHLVRLIEHWTSAATRRSPALAYQIAGAAQLHSSLILMSSSGGSDEVPTVTVRRRRRPTTPPGQRETADAPTR